MAPITYYYFFSIITALGISTWLINLIYLKMKGRTIFGRVYVVGTPMYKRVMEAATGRNILITSIATLLSLANLAWSILVVLRSNMPDVYLLLVAAPVAVALLFPVIVSSVRKQFQTGEFNKAKGKKGSREQGKDHDSWLS